MPFVRDSSTGQGMDVSDLELPGLIESGRVVLDREQLNMVAPSGEVRSMFATDPQFLRSLKDGWRLETPEEGRKADLDAKYQDANMTALLLGGAR